MLQVQQTKITEFLASFRGRCDRHSIKIKLDYQPHGVDKLGSNIDLKTKRITFSTSQIEQISDQLNIPPLDMWEIVASHELGHFFRGSDEHEAWNWVIENCKANSEYIEIARSHALYGSLISAKGNWNQIKKAIASPVTEKFIEFIRLGKTSLMKTHGIFSTPGQCWAAARKRVNYTELETITDVLCRQYKFDLLSSDDDSLEIEIAAIGLYKSVCAYL